MGGSWAIRDGRFLSSSLYFLPLTSAPSSFSPLSYFPTDRGRSEIVGVFPYELLLLASKGNVRLGRRKKEGV